MLRSYVLVLSLLLTSSALADELYVPLSGNAATEIRIGNPSERSTTVVIELMETAFPTSSKTTQITLAGGETAQFSGTEGYGALRINASERLLVTAVRHGAAVPVLDPRDAIADGTITASQTGVGIVNPGSVPALVTVSLHRGDQVIDETSLEVPPRGMRLVRMDRLFGAPANEENQWLTFSTPRRVLPFGYSGDAFTTPAPSATVVIRRRAIRPPAPRVPQTVVLTPSKDNTLYQSTDGSLSNGSGVHLFAGMTNRTELRRTLIAFDVASQIPPGRQITRVVLTLHVSQAAFALQPIELHRVAADWGQSTSDAGTARDGIGAQSRQGDATWIHTFFADRFWSKAGGDFAAAADAAAEVDGIGDNASWPTSAAMIARVQGWLDQPSTNFGWILIGNEATQGTTKRFDSREVFPDSTRPTLTVDYQ